MSANQKQIQALRELADILENGEIKGIAYSDHPLNTQISFARKEDHSAAISLLSKRCTVTQNMASDETLWHANLVDNEGNFPGVSLALALYLPSERGYKSALETVEENE